MARYNKCSKEQALTKIAAKQQQLIDELTMNLTDILVAYGHFEIGASRGNKSSEYNYTNYWNGREAMTSRHSCVVISQLHFIIASNESYMNPMITKVWRL